MTESSEAMAVQRVSPPQPFCFTGDGAEYFRIWIVNISLTILTLGIYSAWAKVRRLQYFYRHTEVAGSSFDYSGSPIAILKGRLIALLLLLAYNFSASFSLTAYGCVLALLTIAMPWLLRNSFRFRLRYSSYRGLRFSFRGTNAGAYRAFLLYGALTFVSLYLLAPLAHQRIKQYQHGESWFGQTRFGFTARPGQFYPIYLLVFGLFLAATVLAMFAFGGVLLALQRGAPIDPKAFTRFGVAVLVTVMLLVLFLGPLFQARIANLVWNHTQLGEHCFESRLLARRLFWIQLTNLLFVIVTLGLFTPWAAVRLARYRAECLILHPAGDLEAFVATQEQDIGATGEETAEFFDIDIGL